MTARCEVCISQVYIVLPECAYESCLISGCVSQQHNMPTQMRI